jgi:hypothetical protein
MAIDPIQAITQEIESAAATENIGMFSIKSANRTLIDAMRRPNPDPLYRELWYEGEVCCLFSDSNLGKSIFAVQMAEEIAFNRKVLLVDCELSDKQFQMRYTDKETGRPHPFPPGLLRAEINPMAFDVKNYEDKILAHIEEAMQKLCCKVAIIDNLTYLCNSSDKGVDAGIFMMKLMQLKKQYGWSLLVVAHTPKRSLSSPITQNDLAGSKKLYNFFDSVIAIGKSAKQKGVRYVKQLKVRAGEFLYDSDNVIVYEIVSTGGYVHFEFKEFGNEFDHLKEPSDSDEDVRIENIKKLQAEGKTYREIANILGIGKSTVSDLIAKSKKLSGVRQADEANEADAPDKEMLADTKNLFD